jgi:hypothetical protein
VHVNLTSKAGATVSVSLLVAPLSPSIWTTVSSSGTSAATAVTLSTTVLSHFYHREQHVNVSFPLRTSAVCGAAAAAARPSSTAMVTRDSDFVESGRLVITGAIHHTVRGNNQGSGRAAAAAAACHTTGQNQATLSFTVRPQQPPIEIVSVVRTSKDPDCAPGSSPGAPPLCGLRDEGAAQAAQAIAEDLNSVNMEQARADHASSWGAFWAVSAISLPSAPETEAFWYGAQYVLNSAIPHAGQEQTPPGLYGPWGSQDNPGWHGDYTIDYNYEAVFYGVMSSNHPELMRSYPNPVLAFVPSAKHYAVKRSEANLNRTCSGLHFPHVLAPWGVPQYSDPFPNYSDREGAMSSGPFVMLPIIWGWEYGGRQNLTGVKERWFPLVKGVSDFFACWLELDETDGFLHDKHDCFTMPGKTECTGEDSTKTLAMVRRALDVVGEMAVAVGAPVDPVWAVTRAKIAPYPSGWMYLAGASSRMTSNATQNCSFCAPFRYDHPGSSGDCQRTDGRVTQLNNCTASTAGVCPAGTKPCRNQVVGGSAAGDDDHAGLPSGGNSQSIFPAFPADAVGTNSSQWTVPMANTIKFAWPSAKGQSNAFTKIFSAAARLVGPGLLTADEVYQGWVGTLKATQQPNGVPFGGGSGFETVGATEYVNYMLLQSDPAGFLGLFEAWPKSAGDASFSRLRGRGAFIVSSSVVGGRVGATTIASERGAQCTLRRPQSWPKSVVSVSVSVAVASEEEVRATAEQKKVALTWEGGVLCDDFFSFSTTVGSIYKLVG